MLNTIQNVARATFTSLHLMGNSETKAAEKIELPDNVEADQASAQQAWYDHAVEVWKEPAPMPSLSRELGMKAALEGDEEVEINEETGNPRLVYEHNFVWDAVDRKGGVEEVARILEIPKAWVWQWIDEHYMPPRVAGKLDLGHIPLPESGVIDNETGVVYPWSFQALDSDMAFQGRYNQFASTEGPLSGLKLEEVRP